MEVYRTYTNVNEALIDSAMCARRWLLDNAGFLLACKNLGRSARAHKLRFSGQN